MGDALPPPPPPKRRRRVALIVVAAIGTLAVGTAALSGALTRDRPSVSTAMTPTEECNEIMVAYFNGVISLGLDGAINDAAGALGYSSPAWREMVNAGGRVAAAGLSQGTDAAVDVATAEAARLCLEESFVTEVTSKIDADKL